MQRFNSWAVFIRSRNRLNRQLVSVVAIISVATTCLSLGFDFDFCFSIGTDIYKTAQWWYISPYVRLSLALVLKQTVLYQVVANVLNFYVKTVFLSINQGADPLLSGRMAEKSDGWYPENIQFCVWEYSPYLGTVFPSSRRSRSDRHEAQGDFGLFFERRQGDFILAMD